MAMSGTINGDAYNVNGDKCNSHYKYYLTWSATANKTNRTASVTFNCYIEATGNYGTYSAYWCNWLSVNGTEYQTANNIAHTLSNGSYIGSINGSPLNKKLSLGSKTITAKYDSAGNAKLTISANFHNRVYNAVYKDWTAQHGFIPNSGGEITISLDNIGSSRIPVTSVTLGSAAGHLAVGETMKLSATVNPSNATDRSLTWSTSNSSIASVTGGTVKALAPGKVTITVKGNATDGSKSDSHTINVFENKGPQGTLNPSVHHNDGFMWVNESTAYGLKIGGTFMNNVNAVGTDIYKIQVGNDKVWFKTLTKSGSLGDKSLTRNGSYANNTSGACATFDHCPTVFNSDRGNPIRPKTIQVTGVNITFYQSISGNITLRFFGKSAWDNNWSEIPISGNNIPINGNKLENVTITAKLTTNNFYTNFKFGIFVPNKFVVYCSTGTLKITSYDVDRSLES